MEFELEKTATLAKTKANVVKTVCREVSDAKVIKSLKEGEGYKYLGIFDVDNFLAKVMKIKASQHNFRRQRKDLNTNLNNGNSFQAVNTWEVSHLLVGEKVS